MMMIPGYHCLLGGARCDHFFVCVCAPRWRTRAQLLTSQKKLQIDAAAAARARTAAQKAKNTVLVCPAAHRASVSSAHPLRDSTRARIAGLLSNVFHVQKRDLCRRWLGITGYGTFSAHLLFYIVIVEPAPHFRCVQATALQAYISAAQLRIKSIQTNLSALPPAVRCTRCTAGRYAAVNGSSECDAGLCAAALHGQSFPAALSPAYCYWRTSKRRHLRICSECAELKERHDVRF